MPFVQPSIGSIVVSEEVVVVIRLPLLFVFREIPEEPAASSILCIAMVMRRFNGKRD